MALIATHNGRKFGVGDKVRVVQKLQDADKKREQAFEGMVIAIKGREENKTFTVRRIGVQKVGVERIFPLESPTIVKIEVVKKGTEGVNRAKLYYTRGKSAKEIDKIYARSARKGKKTKRKRKKKTTRKKKASG